MLQGKEKEMIYLYSGTPGSGKSLHLAKDILFRLRRGGTVIANFTCNEKIVGKREGDFIYKDNSDLTPAYLVGYAIKHHKKGREGQTLLVIDECSVMFNSREYGKKDRMEWIKFFQMHRHFGYNVILCAQTDRLIDRQIRAFVEYDIKHRKMNNFGFVGMLFSLFRLPMFAAVTYWYGVKERIGVDFFMYRKLYGRFYDSYAMFEEAESLGEGVAQAGDPITEGAPSLDIPI